MHPNLCRAQHIYSNCFLSMLLLVPEYLTKLFTCLAGSLVVCICIYCQSVNVFPGQSAITFIYNFVERFEGPHPGFAVLTGRPQEGTLYAI